MKEGIRALLQNWTIEITPRLFAALGDMRRHLPAKTKVYVTFLPGSDFQDSLATCKALLAQGMIPVPHIALRNFPVSLPVRDGLARMAEAGVRDILLIAGAGRENERDVPALLEDAWFAELPLHSIGFAAHPEGNGAIAKTVLDAAEQRKYAFARQHRADCYFITQFCFTPGPVLDWMRDLQARGCALPVHIGIPGLATRKSLLRHARHCGIGASVQYLKRNLSNWRSFFSPRQPDNLLRALAQVKNSPLRRLHFYPLGAFAQTLSWIRAIEENRFTLNNQGFKTHA